jgi:superkiller protein 3
MEEQYGSSPVVAAEPGAAGPELRLGLLAKVAALHVEERNQEALRELQGPGVPEQLPEVHFLRARLHMESENYVDAASSWEAYHRLAQGDSSTRRALAQCYQQAGRWAEASARFESVLELDPGDPDAVLGLGVCQLHLQHYEESLSSFAAYLEKRPGDATARFGAAVANQMLGETDAALRGYEELLNEGQFTGEVLGNIIAIQRQNKNSSPLKEASRRLLEHSPESLAALEGAAYAAYLEDDFQAAAEICERTARLDGDRPERWLNLALCRRRLGDVEGAIAAYEQALRLRPALTEAHVQIVSLLLDTGREEEAAARAQRALVECPDADELSLLLGVMDENLGKVEDAEAVFRTLAERRPDHGDAWFRLGSLQLARGAFDLAQQSFEACLRIRQEWPEARLNLAIACCEGGKAGEAQTLLEGLLEAQPDWEPALRAAAVATLKLGMMDRSLEHHERLLHLGVSEPAIYFNAALLAEQTRGPAEALGYYTTALELQPDFVDALVNMGHALQRLGRRDEARRQWAKAMSLKPELAADYFGIPAK